MFKHLFPLILFALPFTLFGEELPREVPRPAIEGYRHITTPPYIAKPEGITGNYYKVVVSPKMLPDPLLRYRVNIFATEQETGNAYPLHLAALKEFNMKFQQSQESYFRSEAFRKHDPESKEERKEIERLRFKFFPLYYHWGNSMSTEITADEEARFYLGLQNVYALMEKASKKTYFDWSDEYEFKGIATLLPVLHEARALARYLAGKANWEIRNGNYDDAIRTLRVGLAYADHILESKPSGFLVGMMVGVAIKSTMWEQLIFLSAQPDAPNLYPALMQLMVNQKVLHNTIQSETHFLVRQYNDDEFWASLDNLSPEESKSILDGFIALFADSGVVETKKAMSLFQTYMSLIAYQPAKQRLLQKGLSEQEIEALTTYQIIVPFALEEIKRTYDLMVVDASMPIGESRSAISGFDEHVVRLTQNPTNGPAGMMLALLAPATQAARTAFHRQQQTLNLLKIIHAIRYYAAVHDGKLPASLDEITELAVPKMCPITGKMYEYRVVDNMAIIDYSMYSPDKSRIEIVVE